MSADPNFIERRKHPRLKGVYAEYVISGDFDNRDKLTFKPVFLRNFSSAGVSLLVDEEISELEPIIVRLYDEKSKIPIEVMSTLVWSKRVEDSPGKKKYNIGVKFVNVDGVSNSRLRTLEMYLASLEK